MTDKINDYENGEEIQLGSLNCVAKFKEIIGVYTDETALLIGKVRVASYHYDRIGGSKSDKNYVATSPLPTMRSFLGRYGSEKECREVCIKVAELFLTQLVYKK